MNDNYFRRLFLCLLASFSLMVVAHVLLKSPWMSLLAGCGPLVYYHLIYLAPLARRGLTQTAIDSVYYFGFLVTIAALGISAVTIASEGTGTDVNRVVLQFGVGLFATGYAVIARMHLSSISTMVDVASPEAILDKYIMRSMQLVDNVDTAIVRTKELSQTVISTTAEITSKAQADAVQSMVDAARAFKDELNATLGLARDGITEIRGLVADTSFVAEREELARSIKSTVECTTKLNVVLDDFASKAQGGANATAQTSLASAALETRIQAFADQLSTLSGSEGVLAQAVTSIEHASGAMAVSTQNIATTVEALADIASSVVDTGPTFTKMRTHAKKAHDQLDALSSVTERLDSALSGFASSTNLANDFAQSLGRATDIFPELVKRADALSKSFDLASHASSRIETTLDSLPYQTKIVHELSTEVVQSLRAMTEGVSEATRQSEILKANTTQAGNVIASAQQLVDNVGALQGSVQGLQMQVEGLGQSMESTQARLADSSLAIKSAVSSSADILQSDVRRSTEAAALLTERLIAVAQGIIDQTRQRAGTSA